MTHDHADHVGAVPALVAGAGGTSPSTPRGSPGAVATGDGDAVGPLLRAIAVPGHAPDHLCFALGDAVCFTGDAVLGEGSVFIAPDPGALAGYLAGLERLRERGFALLAPGHGPLVDDADAKLAGYVAHRLDRERRLVAALDGGARTHRRAAGRRVGRRARRAAPAGDRDARRAPRQARRGGPAARGRRGAPGVVRAARPPRALRSPCGLPLIVDARQRLRHLRLVAGVVGIGWIIWLMRHGDTRSPRRGPRPALLRRARPLARRDARRGRRPSAPASPRRRARPVPPVSQASPDGLRLALAQVVLGASAIAAASGVVPARLGVVEDAAQRVADAAHVAAVARRGRSPRARARPRC